MSEHRYRTTLPGGTDVTVTAGWDYPLQGFCGNIEGSLDDERLDEENEGFFTSNLHDPEAPPDDRSCFAARLTEHGVTIPSAMTEAIVEGRSHQRRNAETDGSA